MTHQRDEPGIDDETLTWSFDGARVPALRLRAAPRKDFTNLAISSLAVMTIVFWLAYALAM